MDVLNNNKLHNYKHSPEIFLTILILNTGTNSADPDEMLHKVAFHQGLHCLLYLR